LAVREKNLLRRSIEATIPTSLRSGRPSLSSRSKIHFSPTRRSTPLRTYITGFFPLFARSPPLGRRNFLSLSFRRCTFSLPRRKLLFFLGGPASPFTAWKFVIPAVFPLPSFPFDWVLLPPLYSDYTRSCSTFLFFFFRFAVSLLRPSALSFPRQEPPLPHPPEWDRGPDAPLKETSFSFLRCCLFTQRKFFFPSLGIPSFSQSCGGSLFLLPFAMSGSLFCPLSLRFSFFFPRSQIGARSFQFFLTEKRSHPPPFDRARQSSLSTGP